MRNSWRGARDPGEGGILSFWVRRRVGGGGARLWRRKKEALLVGENNDMRAVVDIPAANGEAICLLPACGPLRIMVTCESWYCGKAPWLLIHALLHCGRRRVPTTRADICWLLCN